MPGPLTYPGPKTYPALALVPGPRGPRDVRVRWGRLTTRELSGHATTRTLTGRLTVEEA